MDLQHSARTVRALPRPLLDRIVRFGASLSAAPRRSGGLLAVGTLTYEPWHPVAHLRDAARWSRDDTLVPMLVRHTVPTGARPHLAIGLDRLARAGRGETVLVIAPDSADEHLLERLADARRHGGTVLALTSGPDHDDLLAIAHENAPFAAAELEPAMHLVPLSAAGLLRPTRPWHIARRRAPA